MDAYTLVERLDEVRVRLLEALAPLPDEALTYPGVIGEWSIADVLAHLVNWEAELVTAFHKIDQEKRPGRLLQALKDRDRYNAERFAEMKGRDLERIFDDLQDVRAKVEEWLEEFNDKQLKSPGYYDWLSGRPLWKLIAEVTYEHEASHLEEIEAFADRWLEEEAESTISLTEIEVHENGDRG
ncbi:MAG: DinB family protein [Candidatus Promineifilaceae bacterium]|nr:DinB family protein [Candidatus Promineifilaceae bacterium]